MTEKKKQFHKSRAFYRFVWWLAKLFYPRISWEGAENLPEAPCIIVGNHSQMNGPIAFELYYPRKRLIWCASEMMYWKEVPAYAYRDFWSEKPRAMQWFYKLLSYIITPLSVCIFNNADVIPVYRDNRLLSTFRQTVAALESGTDIIIFPECATPHNNIVYQFQENFVDVARLYYKRTGTAIAFVPTYLAPRRKTMYFGKPVYFDPGAPIAQERKRICREMMDAITEIAASLPLHTVIPYRNISKRRYPKNLPIEVTSDHEKTSG